MDKFYIKLNEKCQFTIVFGNSILIQTLQHSLMGKGGESFGFLSGFPHAHFHSSFRTQCLCFSAHNPGKAERGKKNRGENTYSREWERRKGWDSNGWIEEDLVL